MELKEYYEEPVVEVIHFNTEDVMTDSSGPGFGGGDIED